MNLIHVKVFSLTSITLGWIALLFISTPLFGITACLYYSPLFGVLVSVAVAVSIHECFQYIAFTLLSVCSYTYYLMSLAFLQCTYSNGFATALCSSVAFIGSILFLLAIVVLVLIHFLSHTHSLLITRLLSSHYLLFELEIIC
jgi:hypothetical protein